MLPVAVIATPLLLSRSYRSARRLSQAAQRTGQTVLVDVHADWCLTCREQVPSAEATSRDPAVSRLVILKLDCDGQATERRALGVTKQSMLIA